jgi:hypothetical protein
VATGHGHPAPVTATGRGTPAPPPLPPTSPASPNDPAEAKYEKPSYFFEEKCRAKGSLEELRLPELPKPAMILLESMALACAFWDNQRIFGLLDLLILTSEGSFQYFMHRSKHRIKSYQMGTGRGVLLDGRRFQLLVKDLEGRWMTKVKQLKFKEFELFEGTRLDAYDRNFLEAMVRS